MKLVTINTHSLIEENYPQKLNQFVDFICRETPDLIAMQEVNQSIDAPIYDNPLSGFSPSPDCMIPIRKDNHALQAAALLHAHCLPYYWTWLPVKLGYSKYDEGMAIFSKSPITDIDCFYISTFHDYNYWKTRQILGVKVADSNDWFYTVHMGWWNDEEDPFRDQWKRFKEHLDAKNHSYNIWLLGDFNSPSEVRNEGYDLLKNSGFSDTYELAKTKDVFVIGSAMTYAAMLEYCQEVVVTKVDADGEAEVFFPNLDENPDFEGKSIGGPVQDGAYSLQFWTYERITNE